MERPLLIDWSFTSRCNLDCPFCRGYSETELDHPQALRLAAEMAELRPPRVILEGGEPFLREDLPDVVHILSAASIPVTIFTNGTAINFRWLDGFQRAAIDIAVSVDADEPALYQRLRPGADQRVVWRNILDLRKGGWLSSVVITASRLNTDDVLAVVARARECGVPSVVVIPVKPSRRYESLGLSARQKVALYRQLAAFREETGYPILVDEPFFEPCIGKSDTATSGPVAAPVQGCVFGRYMFIDADGMVAPCTFAGFRVGSASEVGLASLWKTILNDPLIASARDPRQLGGHCRDCPDAERCRGCRVVSAAASGGNLLAADPNCPRNWNREVMS